MVASHMLLLYTALLLCVIKQTTSALSGPLSYSSSSLEKAVAWGSSTTRMGSNNRFHSFTKQDQQRNNYEARTVQDFVTRNSRTSFVRKVYSIFSCQMISTILVTTGIMRNSDIQNWLFTNYAAVSFGSFVLSLSAVLSLVYSPKLRYTQPINYVLLGVHTLCQSIMLGAISTLFSTRTMCLGTLHTLFAFLALTVYSFQKKPKYDLTVAGNTLLTGSVCGIVALLLGKYCNMPLLDNLTSMFFAILMAVYLAFDTQKIVGGRHHKYKYGQKEYILAAINLYQDVYNLCLKILQLLENRKK